MLVMARSDKYIPQLVARKAVIAAGFDAALRPFADQSFTKQAEAGKNCLVKPGRDLRRWEEGVL